MLSPAIGLSGQCGAWHDQAGSNVLCGRCSAGYAPSFPGSSSSECVKCESVSGAVVFGFIAWPWLWVFLYYCLSFRSPGVIAIFLYSIQTAAVMVTDASSVSSWVRFVGFNGLSFLESDSCIGPLDQYWAYGLSVFVPMMQCAQLFIMLPVIDWVTKWRRA